MVLGSAPKWMLLSGGAITCIGAIMLIWAVRGDRSRGRRRCPKCWYQMQGVPGLRCPECGAEARRDRDLLRPKRRWRMATLALLITLIAPGALVYQRFHERGWYWLLPKYKQISSTDVGGWRVIMLDHRDPDDWGQAIRIQRAGKPTFEIEGYHLDIGEVSAPDQGAPHVGVGEDITGDGVPDLIISDFSGGAHCCTTYHILSLGPDAVIQHQAIDTQNSGANFHDLDGDGLPEMITADNNFVYWNGPYAGSPKPRVILKWLDGRYAVAGDLMRAAPPTEARLAERAKAIRDDPNWAAGRALHRAALPSSGLWDEMLDLIYAGHADFAWQFLRDAWPDDRPGRMEFMVDFIAQLGHSQYWWEGVRAMNLPDGEPVAGVWMP